MIRRLVCYLGIHWRVPYARAGLAGGLPVEGWRCSRCGRLKVRKVER
jgi:hypothetical protein